MTLHTVNAASDAGVLLSRAELECASKLCQEAGAWLVVDNTYEHFTYDNEQHECVHGPHVINVFSFSKVWWQHAAVCQTPMRLRNPVD
jgi:aromatic aminotransferase